MIGEPGGFPAGANRSRSALFVAVTAVPEGERQIRGLEEKVGIPARAGARSASNFGPGSGFSVGANLG
jgi:hypothetical protein